MTNFEVPEPILNSPFSEPARHWLIREGEPPECIDGRRPAGYYFRDPRTPGASDEHEARGTWVELAQINLVRKRMADWRVQGRPGVTRTTHDLLSYWTRDGRERRLFFAQLEAAETIIFLNEARADFLQGIDIPRDEPGDQRKAEGFGTFRRLGCKMATGSGKTTVMGMLAAWSILNKTTNRGDARFSDVVLVVCPNVTIRNRLQELDPLRAEASLYRTRDLVPERLMPELSRGRVLLTNWHVFEPQGSTIGGTGARVIKTGKATRTREKFVVGGKTTSFRRTKYITPQALEARVASGDIIIIDDKTDKGGRRTVTVEGTSYVESDTALVNRVVGRAVGGKQNILVFNDEAHHAYRIRRSTSDEEDGEAAGEGEDADEKEDRARFFTEATVWIDGLDKINKLRGINFCVDLSATPYFLGRVGQQTNRIFPWVVSDFGLTDAIESGLVKIPQLAVRDTSGEEIPGYFNIWRWILPKLTSAERGGRKGSPKPEAILKWSNTPISMLGGLWEERRREWSAREGDPRPPVFILVCKNTRIAKVVYEWIAEGIAPTGIPPCQIGELRNRNGQVVTIRVDTKVVQESDTDQAKSDEVAWMRHTLDTVGKLDWTRDAQGRPVYPEKFEELARKMGRPFHPPGRDVRCIVSVGMLTEGWDCNTVTHIVGLRPFMSQLLCEQVVGRGLRRSSYDDFTDTGLLTEEVAMVFGVPFEVIPFKENKGAPQPPAPKRHHVHAIPDRNRFEIKFPRVDGYRQAIRNRVSVNWSAIPTLELDPKKIPAEVELKGMLPNNKGRPSLTGPGKLVSVDLSPFRKGRRLQELAFEMARDLTRDYVARPDCDVPTHVLFPQLVAIVDRHLREKLRPIKPAHPLDVFLSPYYGWVIERLVEAIHPDTSQGEAPELPVFEKNRGLGSTGEVDFWTSRDVREVLKSHVNYVVADTKVWEQSAAYQLDKHENVTAFVKNAGLGLSIPYLHNGEPHDYEPDFLVKLIGDGERYLILETKGYDPLAGIKAHAAERWVAAVNADQHHGRWTYRMVRKPEEVDQGLAEAMRS